MKLDAECYPCMMGQAYRAAMLSGLEGADLRKAMRLTADILGNIDPDSSPPEAAAVFYDQIKAFSGVDDPFLRLKEEGNRKAMELLPMLRNKAEEYSDPLFLALRAAVAGNIMDFGAQAEPGDPGDNLRMILEEEPFIDHGPQLRRDLESASRVLIICDNAGEIAMDRFLCEILTREFPHAELTAAVRGGPAINDALLEDARQVGLDGLCRVITTGLAMAGVDPARASLDFLAEYEKSDVILAKGQGNFETLESEEANLYFLFQVKCDCVSAYLGARKGLAVIWGRRV